MSAAQAVHSGAGRSATVNAGTQRQLSSWKPLRSGQKNALIHGSENYFNSLVEQHQKTKALAKRSYATLVVCHAIPYMGLGSARLCTKLMQTATGSHCAECSAPSH